MESKRPKSIKPGKGQNLPYEGKEAEELRRLVKEAYRTIAVSGASCCGPEASCFGEGAPGILAAELNYDPTELEKLPLKASSGLSCGNPLQTASLRSGEVVLDLGCGGGLDCLIAALKVGQKGKVIGLDMTWEMLQKARRNAEGFSQHVGFKNVDFVLAEIENLPLEDRTADVVISNCVINLSPEKQRVWKEIARVLKPGGRVSITDMALLRPVPAELRSMVEALVGCIAGACTIEETSSLMAQAGLAEINVKVNSKAAEAIAKGADPIFRKILKNLPPETKITDYVTSAQIQAIKPK